MTLRRIRNGRRGPESRAANQQRHSAGPRDGSSSTSQSRRGGRGGLNANRSTDNFQNGPKSQSPLPPPDDHVPMPGFNREAVEAMLRQGYDMRAPLYKPETKSQTGKPESPWGVKREHDPSLCRECTLISSLQLAPWPMARISFSNYASKSPPCNSQGVPARVDDGVGGGHNPTRSTAFSGRARSVSQDTPGVGAICGC